MANLHSFRLFFERFAAFYSVQVLLGIFGCVPCDEVNYTVLPEVKIHIPFSHTR